MSEELNPLLRLACEIEEANTYLPQSMRDYWRWGALSAVYGCAPNKDLTGTYGEGYLWAQQWLKENSLPNRDAQRE